MPNPTSVTSCVEAQLEAYNTQLGALLRGDVLSVVGDLIDGVDLAVRDFVESVGDESRLETLVVMLTTRGGSIEVVARIVEILRHHYSRIEFVIPSSAYSAGTVLALSGDAIRMDYYSRLGPIDPQVVQDDGTTVPALGYLGRYEELVERARLGIITSPEIAVLLDFDQAFLYKLDQAKQLSIRLLKEWLVKYKFKDWTTTEKRGLDVDDTLRESRAEEIALALSDINRWNSHGYGISMDVLQNELKLQINDYGRDPDLADAIRDYHDLLQDSLVWRGREGALHSSSGYHA